ncbi:AmmeMemoRadiSam system radical SAM enzyme [Anaeromyxobacter diazotrophicus]|uniref:AmmeMemoRadiSam system radical SAM enzyme n=1 Tax=Anaeromyxobacter diazotrophicus TaxID=2590199 RepID=A0A7I9VR36_9BACT|nr:AmmeMemoRadiSam system radical SAM enzyme [Anaeromyxobacter diazotrophicus]GEJ58718.1 AmmeMemoRadiSam system radical SAM enzyme [Anaeromyxobacter diazotrophicus]
MQARYFEREEDGRLRCTLCPRACRLADGQAGFCFVRQNVGGRMVSLAYGRSTGFAVDPIEKKPLDHFFPGTNVLSFGTAGCNLGCRFCQNWSISKARVAERRSQQWGPREVVDLAIEAACPAIAFTYNDPVIWAEYAIDVAKEARARGLKTVFVTAGYVAERAREEIFAHMDATNVDLKGFTEDFYRKVTLAHLAPVLETLAWLARTDVWVEVTNLVIPGLNDSPAEARALAAWVGEHMGAEVPLHFTAFHPDFRMLDVPPTPPETLARARAAALEVGLRHVYTGNVHDREGQTTRCAGCGEALIVRDALALASYRLAGDRCPRCGAKLAGRFGAAPRTPGDGRPRYLGLA